MYYTLQVVSLTFAVSVGACFTLYIVFSFVLMCAISTLPLHIRHVLYCDDHYVSCQVHYMPQVVSLTFAVSVGACFTLFIVFSFNVCN